MQDIFKDYRSLKKAFLDMVGAAVTSWVMCSDHSCSLSCLESQRLTCRHPVSDVKFLFFDVASQVADVVSRYGWDTMNAALDGANAHTSIRGSACFKQKVAHVVLNAVEQLCGM